MAKNGPVLILEDDEDDRQIYDKIISSLGMLNKVIFFDGGDMLLEYLKTTKEQPFIIIADINLPRMNGIELWKKINADDYLRKKSIPFVYLTTIESREIVQDVYEVPVQGYFVKLPFYEDVKRQMKLIFDYWVLCRHPNDT